MIVIEFFNWLFQGTRGNIVSAATAAIISGWIVTRLTYSFQKKLLAQQVEAQEKSHQELLRVLKIGGDEAKKQAEAIASAAWNIAAHTIPRDTIRVEDTSKRR